MIKPGLLAFWYAACTLDSELMQRQKLEGAEFMNSIKCQSLLVVLEVFMKLLYVD